MVWEILQNLSLIGMYGAPISLLTLNSPSMQNLLTVITTPIMKNLSSRSDAIKNFTLKN